MILKIISLVPPEARYDLELCNALCNFFPLDNLFSLRSNSRFMSSFGISTPTGTLKYRRLVCTRALAVVERMQKQRDECSFMFSTRACVYCIHTCHL